MSIIVTSNTLETVYQRINSNWLVRHGLDRFNRVVFRSRDGSGTLLVCLQRPELRNPTDYNNFIIFKDGLNAYLRYEREFNTTVRFFLVDETFDWRRLAVPLDNQILAFGRTESLENICERVRQAGPSLLVRGSDERPVFFLDERFQPIVSIGVDPDLEPAEEGESALLRLRRKTNRANDNNGAEKLHVDIQLFDGKQTVSVVIGGVTIDELLADLTKIYRVTDVPPF